VVRGGAKAEVVNEFVYMGEKLESTRSKKQASERLEIQL
jgi:hypothetical protein